VRQHVLDQERHDALRMNEGYAPARDPNLVLRERSGEVDAKRISPTLVVTHDPSGF
jgi:hypothetical protein